MTVTNLYVQVSRFHKMRLHKKWVSIVGFEV